MEIKLSGRFGLGLNADTNQVMNCIKEMLSVGHGGEICLNFSELEFIYPSGVNILSAVGKYLMADRKCKIFHIYPKDKEVSNFLSECGFCEFVGVEAQLNGKAPQHNGTYIYKIRRFDFPDDYEIEQLINIIEKELKLSSNVCNHIHESLAELILNVQQHSGSKTGCFVLGQGYQKTHRVRVCISDLGIGIKNHLARKFNDLI